MKINLFKTAEIYAVLLLTVGMMGCQPQSSSVATLAQTDRVVQIEAKTVPIKGAAKVVCEIEGCVRFIYRRWTAILTGLINILLSAFSIPNLLHSPKLPRKILKKPMSCIIWISALSKRNLSVSVPIWRLLL